MNINALPSAAFYVSVSDYATILPAYRKATHVLEKRNCNVLALGDANHLEIIEANFGSSVSKGMLCSMPLTWFQHIVLELSLLVIFFSPFFMWVIFIVLFSYCETLCQTNEFS